MADGNVIKGPYAEEDKAELAKKRGAAAALIKDPDEKRKFIAAQGKVESTGVMGSQDHDRLSKEADDTLATGGLNKEANVRSYKHGTDYVPKTGPANLHEGEAVLKKKDAEQYRAGKGDMSIYDLAQHHMGGGEHKKHKKEVKEIRTRKAKSGGYIHEHHHTHPEDHPMEEHTTGNDDEMAQHMLSHMGTPNDGEAAGAQPQEGSGEGMGGAAMGGAAMPA